MDHVIRPFPIRAWKYRKARVMPTTEFLSPISISTSLAALRTPDKMFSIFFLSSISPNQSNTSNKKGKCAARLRLQILRLVTFSAVLNWLLSVLGYVALASEGFFPGNATSWRLSLKSVICILSFLQAFLVAFYWNVSRKHGKVMRLLSTYNEFPLRRSKPSALSIVLCTIESVLQLLVPFPNLEITLPVTFREQDGDMMIDIFLFCFILLRNYHTLRLLYWRSHLEDMRTKFLARLANVQYSTGFVLRWWLARRGWTCVVGICSAGMVAASLLLSLADKPTREVWNAFWLIASAQVTIGYAESRSDSTAGRVVLVLSAFLGILALAVLIPVLHKASLLTATDLKLCSSLLLAQQKRANSSRLIQSWGLQTRCTEALTKTLKSRLRVQLNKLPHTQAIGLQRSIESMRQSTHKHFRGVAKALRPVRQIQSDVCSMQAFQAAENERRIAASCRSLLKAIRLSICGSSSQETRCWLDKSNKIPPDVVQTERAYSQSLSSEDSQRSHSALLQEPKKEIRKRMKLTF